ncbi:GATA zinc finger protein [Colletotrichum tofieldiae]|uniref:GATA zinc finger protein n=1 Tax=Colletotrichum tofieldiae TaxID=708197 RepID=A0A166U4K9_9PEZI|nr:GATA zinc finger protein [Colletotrichum tofieldiae]
MELSDCETVKPNPKGSATVFTETSDTVSVSPHMPNGDKHGNVSTPLSLNQLKAGELLQRMLVQWQVHEDTSQLLDKTQGLLHFNVLSGGNKWNEIPGVVVNQSRLILAQALSQHIAASVDELVMLCHESATNAEPQVGQYFPGQQRRKMRRNNRTDSSQKQRRTSQLICHSCQTTSTPKWRNGPAGLWTLCNVCGLVSARQVRKNGRVKSGTTFPVASPEYGCNHWQMRRKDFVEEPNRDLSSIRQEGNKIGSK